MARYGAKQIGVGAVAVAVTVGCTIYTVRRWREHDPARQLQPRRPGIAEQAKATALRQSARLGDARRSATGEVRNWRLRALPALLPRDFPAISQFRVDEAPLDPRSDARGPYVLPSLLPVVVIEIEVFLWGAEGEPPPAFWPGSAGLVLERGPAETGPFAPVLTVPQEQLVALAPERDTVADSARNAFAYRLRLLDAKAPSGSVHYYRARVTGADGAALAESGVCTAVVFQPPAVQATVDEKRVAHLSWAQPELSPEWFIGTPCLVVGMAQPLVRSRFWTRDSTFSELARLPVGAGTFDFPFPLDNAVVSAAGPVAHVVIEGTLPYLEWAQESGQRRSLALTALGGPVLRAPGRALARQQRHEGGDATLVPEAERACPYQPGGRQIVFWIRPRALPPWKATRFEASYGDGSGSVTIPNLGPSPYGEKGRRGQRCTYRLHVTNGAEDRTLEATAYSPPLPTGLRAHSGSGPVRLQWDPVRCDPQDWLQGPEFVVRRVSETEIVGRLSGGRVPLPPILREVYRGPVGVTEFTDTDSQPGAGFFYALELEGVVRATAASSELGSFTVPLAVGAGSASWDGSPPVFAKPEPAGPVRLAVGCGAANSLESGRIREAVLERLGRLPWIRIVERDQAGRLFDEAQLRAFSESSGQDQSAMVELADRVLRCVVRKQGMASTLEVDLAECRGPRVSRVGSWPMPEPPWDEIVARATALLKEDFADWETRGASPAAPAASGRRPSLAVLDFMPQIGECERTLPEGALAELLTSAVAADSRFVVVERSQLQRVLTEQGLSAALDRDNTLRLGSLLNAECVLSGSYSLKGGQLAIQGRLVSVGTGSQLAAVEYAGPDDDLAAAAAGLAAKLPQSLASPPSGTPASSPLLRALDAQASARTLVGVEGAKAAAFVAPSARGLYTLGLQQRQQGDPEAALNSFRQAIRLAGPDDDNVVLYYQSTGEVMADLKRPAAERVQFWQQALASAVRGSETRRFWVDLAEALADAGQTEAVVTLLEQHADSPSTARTAALWERVGREPQAVDGYLKGPWLQADPGAVRLDGRRLGSGYVSVIRYLRAATGDRRRQVLEAIATQLGSDRPVQATMAARELLAGGPFSAGCLRPALEAAAAVGDADLLAALLANLSARPAKDIDTLRALAGAARLLQRLGRAGEAQRFAKQVKAAPFRSAEADTIREGLARAFAADRRRPQPVQRPVLDPGIDDSLWAYVADRGGRSLAPDSSVFVLTETGFVLNLDPARHQVLWQHDLELRRPFPEAAATPGERRHLLSRLNDGFWLAPDAVYATNFADGVLHAIDIATGRRRWLFREWTTLSPAVVWRETGDVCVADGFGNLSILNPKDGSLRRHLAGPATVATQYREWVPGLSRLHQSSDQGETQWTDWLRVSLGGDGMFWRLDYYTTRRTNPDGTVWIEANADGSHSFNVTTGELRVDDPQLAGGAADAWAQAMRSGSTEDRATAVARAFWAKDAKKNLPELLRILRDEAEPVRVRKSAIESVIRLGGKETLGAVVDLLASSEFSLSMEAARALCTNPELCRDPPPELLGRLAELAHGKDADVARRALHCLLRLGGVTARSMVEDILAGPASETRSAVIRLLAEEGDNSVIPLLEAELAQQPAEAQTETLQLLSRLGAPKARDAYIASLHLDECLAQAAAASQRGATDEDRRAVEKVLTALEVGAPDPRLIPFLTALARHFEGQLLPQICRILGKTGSWEAVPFLIEQMPEERAARRPPGLAGLCQDAARMALCQIGGPSAPTDRSSCREWLRQHAAKSGGQASATPERKVGQE